MAKSWPNPKDPNDVLDYELLWATWLKDDTIADSNWEVPAGLTKDSQSFTNTTTTVWLSGGTAGEVYTLTNRITTVGGRIKDWSTKLSCKET